MTTKYRHLTRVGLFCALIAVCALLQVPFDPPFTLQTFAVFLCAGVLGGKWGCAAVLCYLALVKVMPDGWTVKTADGKLSAHYENTVLITDGDPEILTVCDNDAE